MMSRRIAFGRYIRSRRVNAGLTFRELSALSGLTPTLTFSIEKGLTEPRLTTIEKLARGFGESALEFLGQYYSRTLGFI